MKRCRSCVSACAWLLLQAACGPAGTPAVERFDVEVRVLPNGSVEVRETVTLGPSPGAAREFSRRISPARADAVTFVAASIDGTSVGPDGPGDPPVVASGRRRLDVRVVAAATRPTVVTVQYLAAGAVAVRGGRGLLRWAALPTDRGYSIGSSRIRLDVPVGAHLYAGAGIAESGWTVARESGGVVGERTALGSGEGATIVAEFSVDRGVIVEPAWQFNEEWSRELVPAFVAGALFVLIVGVGILWLIRFRSRGGAHGPSERESTRAGLRIAGWVVIVFGVVAGAVTWAALADLGFWPLVVPGSIVAVGLAFVGVTRWIV